MTFGIIFPFLLRFHLSLLGRNLVTERKLLLMHVLWFFRLQHDSN